MKKNKKNIVVFSISVASICFTSYKILKKVKPKKIELLKNNLKDIVSNDKNKKEEIKSPVLKEKKCYNNKTIKPVPKNDKIKDDNKSLVNDNVLKNDKIKNDNKPLDSAISNNNILDNDNTLYIKT